MRQSRVIFLFCGVLVFAVLGAYAVYAARKPVVVVTDASFEELYGRARGERRRAMASLALWRRIVVATVAESAAPAAAADSAAAAVGRPVCVVFPSRYAAGAAVYAGLHPDIPTVVVGGAAEAGPGSPVRFSADREMDLYRAGRIAGLLSAAGGRPVLLARDFSVRLSSFLTGLADSRYEGEPITLVPGAPLPAGAACVVALDLDGRLSPELQALPLVLFSWIDPKLVPATTVAIFDDSIWALLVPVVAAASGGEAAVAPSSVWFPSAIGRKASRQLKAAATARYMVHNSL